MRPYVYPEFWSDPEIEQQPAGVKLCMLWLITNSNTSLLGICGATSSRFTLETGLPAAALEKTLLALPRTLVRVGTAIFIRNYIRRQFGAGESLIKNNFFKPLSSLFLGVKDDKLRSVILTEYPEFNEALQRASKGGNKPQYSTVQRKRGGIGGERELAIEIYEAYPRKVGRPNAIRAIYKALTKYSANILLSRTKAFAATCNGDIEFCPNPATWFNQERFNDDPSTWKRNGPPKKPVAESGRGAGTTNEGRSSQYAGVGKVA